MELIRINNYFFEPSNYDIEEVEIGNSRRSFNGTLHEDIITKYKVFNIELRELSPTMHENLLFLLSINRSFGELTAENLSLFDENDMEYIVTIPLNGYKFEREEGFKETYKWEITLEEVI